MSSSHEEQQEKKTPKGSTSEVVVLFKQSIEGSMNHHMGAFTTPEGRVQGNVVQASLKMAVALLLMDNSLVS